MTLPRILLILSVLLFGSIIAVSLVKKRQGTPRSIIYQTAQPVEVELNPDEPEQAFEVEKVEMPQSIPKTQQIPVESVQESQEIEIDRIQEFFNKKEPVFPIVKTITYKSRVPWKKGKAAWVSDYASHYKTSRHFIARSLNGSPNYEKQDVKEGDRFNVFNDEKNFEFYLLVDLPASKMRFYYIDKDAGEKVFVKAYPVSLGRQDPGTVSGYLTPLGKYTLGNKIAVYHSKSKGIYRGDKIEMATVFGTRWIPFEEEISECTEPARGLGIHGLPLKPNAQGELAEDLASLGKYESDGCIRMAGKDIEELFAIIITQPTTIEIVKGA